MSEQTRQFVKVASESEVGEGSVLVVEPHGHRIALTKSDGKYFAIDDRCTHDNGPLGEGELIDGQIECPRHGARFDIRTGKAMTLPATGKVSTYNVEVRDGEIWLSIPEKF